MTNHGEPFDGSDRVDHHRLRGPAELIQAVPYLLGFHPAESLVFVGLCDGNLAVAARLDLADAEADLVSDDPAAAGMVGGTLTSMRRGGTDAVIAVVYCEGESGVANADADLLPRARLVLAAETVIAASGCELVDAFLVRENMFWSYTGDACASGCCPVWPAHGTSLPTTPSAFAAAATLEGKVPMPDRAALAAGLQPLSDVERASLLPGIEARTPPARSPRRALMAAARACAEARWSPPDDPTAAAFVAALRDTPTRHALWLAVDGRRIDGRTLWRDLARRAPTPWDVAPLFLYGWASWRAGDGAQANIAATRVLEIDPTFAAADLLLAALSQGVDPRTFPRLRRSA